MAWHPIGVLLSIPILKDDAYYGIRQKHIFPPVILRVLVGLRAVQQLAWPLRFLWRYSADTNSEP